ncbi:YkvA family protein [Neobacillus muris]|uniref:YkvA family protein n=1 Tax=Neobacillus muris TaxID=2941334 RepID=UPI0020405162|nr:YkvA family protein [Neobacillus muris]
MEKDSNFENGYKKYESKAGEYIHDKEKADGLLKEAIKKANDKKGALSGVWEKLQLLLEFFKAWNKGEYKEVPTRSLVMIIAGILYFVSPIDLVPDFIVGLGLVDDAAVIGFVLKQISNDLEKFKAWKERKE